MADEPKYAPTPWSPGPWRLRDDNGQICDASGRIVAYATLVPPLAEALASARLIAAAPDLCDALAAINRCASPNPARTFDGTIRDLMLITDVARAALAKARGETP